MTPDSPPPNLMESDQQTESWETDRMRSRAAGMVIPGVILAMGLAVAAFALPFAKPASSDAREQSKSGRELSRLGMVAGRQVFR